MIAGKSVNDCCRVGLLLTCVGREVDRVGLFVITRIVGSLLGIWVGIFVGVRDGRKVRLVDGLSVFVLLFGFDVGTYEGTFE